MKMSPAQWLRTTALFRRLPTPPIPPINREQYAELARLAGNINQLSHHINSSLVPIITDNDVKLLRDLGKTVMQIRLTLIGVDTNDSQDD
jgi:hypothetical protein